MGKNQQDCGVFTSHSTGLLLPTLFLISTQLTDTSAQVELKTGSVYLAWPYKSSARLDWPRKKEPLFKQESNAAEWFGLD